MISSLIIYWGLIHVASAHIFIWCLKISLKMFCQKDAGLSLSPSAICSGGAAYCHHTASMLSSVLSSSGLLLLKQSQFYTEIRCNKRMDGQQKYCNGSQKQFRLLYSFMQVNNILSYWKFVFTELAPRPIQYLGCGDQFSLFKNDNRSSKYNDILAQHATYHNRLNAKKMN